MIKLIVGEKGTGKTKALLDGVQQALDKDHGSVVFVNNNKRHVFDLNYKIRMIDTSEFNITSFDELYGLLCGIISQNYDITNLFVDSITKIAEGSNEEIAAFLNKINAVCDSFNIEMVLTMSKKADELDDEIKKYTE